ncbi:chromatin associated protein KTI12 [Punctularia strigosozonata HHB-11173 SS5]|uniref:chromatin associated protein KTI12 n=1 Tax=Punctularia strigosozonata (strain HHB-11173) TaxID=741275 RepID=UPI00044179A5|nr:chromatin associated protein KTI12 [Punctularia strigosozonata HHB-11173 SS5]EIN11621.1 chromatin associated protein KTI12 [Punctularia strigosozonata HHB-11173 SS5]
MALITVSGYPSSGKTRRAEQLRAHLEQRLADPSYIGPKLKVVVVSDDTLSLPRSVYNDSRSEKPARGALFTAAQRAMGRDTILILDSLNYIKGFRYQIYCAAREFKVRMCTLYVVATHEHCRTWNAARTDGRAYEPETLDNLLLRYEEPSSMVRWDSPLFTVPWTDEHPPYDDIWRAITTGEIKAPNVGTQAVAKAPTDALRTLEHITASIVSCIMAEQSSSGIGGGPLTLSVPSSSATSPAIKQTVTLPPRNASLAELQRLKRQFVAVHKKAITLGTTEKGAVDWSERAVATKFAEYLEENVRP